MQYNKIRENRIRVEEAGKQLSVTIATRFDRDTASLLREVAREKGIGVTTLIRMWTLDRLKRVNRGGQRGGLIGVSAWLGKDRVGPERVAGEGSNQGQ